MIDDSRFADRADSPLGPLYLTANGTAVTGIYLPKDARTNGFEGAPRRPHPLLDRARLELDAYFLGDRRTFSFPMQPLGTPFQTAVWTALCAIPFGTTTSYGAIAESLGRPSAARAVGAANGKNPISIAIPCHRVVGSDGALTGYAGGIEGKRWLLEHEAAGRPASTTAAVPYSSVPSRLIKVSGALQVRAT